MKKLFVFALLANIGLFGWYQFGRKPEASTPPEAALHADQIKVITEAEIPASTPAKPEIAETTASQPVEAAASVAPLPETPAKVAEVACFTLGPVQDADWANARQQLRNAGITPLKPTATETASKYWVYIPPLASAELAQKKADQLKALEISDFFIIQDGSKWQHAISLGIFSSKEAADKQLTTLQAQGVRSAIVRPREPINRTWQMAFRKLNEEKSNQLRTLAKGLYGAVLNKTECQ